MVTKGTSGKRKLGVFNTLVLVFNVFFIVALLLSYLSVHISPEKIPLLPFFGLMYPYFVLVNLFFVIYWIFRRRWIFLFSFIVIAAGWNHLGRTIQIDFGGHDPAIANQFKLITYNVKNLSNDNVDLLEPSIRNKIISFLEHEDPDLVCLQEFAVIHPDPEKFIDSLSTLLSLPFHAHTLYLAKPRRLMDGIFIFSKFPIINSGPLYKDKVHNYGLFADVITGPDTARIINVHLESVRLKNEDYTFIADLDLKFEEEENIKEHSKRIFNKLSSAFEKRAEQVDTLVKCIERSPYPVILCGDFNDTPNSYTYQQLTANLEDAFIESGTGLGNTYIGNLPSYRIDYILHDDHFGSRDCRRILVKYSDHYPVSCSIHLR